MCRRLRVLLYHSLYTHASAFTEQRRDRFEAPACLSFAGSADSFFLLQTQVTLLLYQTAAVHRWSRGARWVRGSSPYAAGVFAAAVETPVCRLPALFVFDVSVRLWVIVLLAKRHCICACLWYQNEGYVL